MTADIHSIWLMPGSADGAWLEAELKALAGRFGTPLFTPHLTVRGDTATPLSELAAAIAKAAAEVAAFDEPIAAIETSEAYFRSFYARFAIGSSLSTLKRLLDPAEAGRFMPHVSLLYGPVSAVAKAQAADRCDAELTGRPVRFDRLCVVRSGQDIPIADWAVVETAWLAGASPAGA